MYAYNKRFRPTLHLGVFTVLALATGMFGLLLIVFSIACFVQLDNTVLGLVLLLGAAIMLFIAVKEQRGITKKRLLPSMFVGKRDVKARRLELG